jgi:ectoine hydroxylase-related dioxygenase (phytanoyl-CoA dioxygenase family)
MSPTADSLPPLHPRNKEFRWPSVKSGASFEEAGIGLTYLTAMQAEQFDRDGFIVLSGIFDPHLIRELTEVIDAHESEYVDRIALKPASERTAKDDTAAAVFMPHLVAVSSVVRSFCASPVFGEIATDLLGPSVRVYWDQAVYKKSERPREFPWHQDNGLVYIEPQNYLTCWVPLTPAHRRNGCLWLLAGQHRRGMLDHEETPDGLRCRLIDTADAIAVELLPGDLLVFSSLTPHRSGPNMSSAPRKALIVQYGLDGSTVFRDPDLGIHDDMLMDDPVRQYYIARNGRPVAPEPLEF